ncbi:hypothetical protein TYRP_015886, partial [Tyrophagus putrescentiae]
NLSFKFAWYIDLADQPLLRSKLSPSGKVLPFNCSNGTAFLLVVLVARNWYNLIFFNRIEPKPLKGLRR